MTPEQNKRQQQLRPHILKAINDVGAYGTAEGWLRYEAIKKLNVLQFGAIRSRSLKGGSFDDIIDELILNQKAPQ